MDNVLNEFLFDLYLIGQDIVKKPPDKDDMSSIVKEEEGSGPLSLS